MDIAAFFSEKTVFFMQKRFAKKGSGVNLMARR
jgi:hypothetical protein